MFRAKNLKLEELDLAKQSWRYDRMPEIPASNYRSIAWTIYDEKREAFKILIEVTRRPSSFRNEDCGIVISQTLAYIAFILGAIHKWRQKRGGGREGVAQILTL